MTQLIAEGTKKKLESKISLPYFSAISSEDYAYVGNGFDAGECGIRFNNLWRNDSGEWSCNVGVAGDREELSRGFDVSIYGKDPVEDLQLVTVCESPNRH